jgi:hypothetical protein
MKVINFAIDYDNKSRKSLNSKIENRLSASKWVKDMLEHMMMIISEKK